MRYRKVAFSSENESRQENPEELCLNLAQSDDLVILSADENKALLAGCNVRTVRLYCLLSIQPNRPSALFSNCGLI